MISGKLLSFFLVAAALVVCLPSFATAQVEPPGNGAPQDDYDRVVTVDDIWGVGAGLTPMESRWNAYLNAVASAWVEYQKVEDSLKPGETIVGGTSTVSYRDRFIRDRWISTCDMTLRLFIKSGDEGGGGGIPD